MAQPLPYGDDDELLRALSQALQLPVPQRVRDDALAVFTWRTVDAELAALAYDSALEPLAVRGGAEPARTLTFTSGDLVVELELTEGVLVGQLAPAQAGSVALRRPDGGPAEVAADELGCFRLEPVPGGPFSLHVRTADSEVVTEWLTL